MVRASKQQGPVLHVCACSFNNGGVQSSSSATGTNSAFASSVAGQNADGSYGSTQTSSDGASGNVMPPSLATALHLQPVLAVHIGCIAILDLYTCPDAVSSGLHLGIEWSSSAQSCTCASTYLSYLPHASIHPCMHVTALQSGFRGCNCHSSCCTAVVNEVAVKVYEKSSWVACRTRVHAISKCTMRVQVRALGCHLPTPLVAQTLEYQELVAQHQQANLWLGLVAHLLQSSMLESALAQVQLQLLLELWLPPLLDEQKQ